MQRKQAQPKAWAAGSIQFLFMKGIVYRLSTRQEDRKLAASDGADEKLAPEAGSVSQRIYSLILIPNWILAVRNSAKLGDIPFLTLAHTLIGVL